MPTFDLDSLSPRELAAQLVVPVLDLREAAPNDPEEGWACAESLVEDGVGGLILFGGEREALGPRLTALKAKAKIPLLVGADLERGVAQQVSGCRQQPPLMALGAASSEELAERAGAALAQEARALGIDWVLGPVLDLAYEPRNPIVGTRALGADPERVAALGAAFVRGVEGTGALACAKHFPGHGATIEDSHDAQPVVRRSARRLRAEDMLPFREALSAGVSSVMTAHVRFPALAEDPSPATLNPELVRGLLRRELGYEGLVVTDALIMDGVHTDAGEAAGAVRAIAAGCDLLLYPRDPRGVIEALAQAAESPVGLAHLREAAGRVLARKARLTIAGDDDAQDASDAIARQGLTRLGEARAPLASGDAAAFVVFDDDGVPGLGHELAARLEEAGVSLLPVTVAAPVSGSVRGRLVAATSKKKRIVAVVGCRVRAWKGRPGLARELRDVLRSLPPENLTVVGLCGPYPLRNAIAPGAELLVAYGDEAACQAAAAAVLLGAPAPGCLPVPSRGLLA